jgi:hypothetical protein
MVSNVKSGTLLATNATDFKAMMMINSKEKKLVVATLDEQKKRNIIDKPLVEHWESDDSNPSTQDNMPK